GDATTSIPTRPPALPLGDLADRMNAAWANVTSYRAHYASANPAALQPRPGATPVALAASIEVTEEVASPTRRRQTFTGAGANDHEAIIDGPTLYVRGPIAAAILPGTPPDAWLAFPAAAISPESEAGQILASFAMPSQSPLAAVGDNLRPQGLRDLGPVEVAGRACRAWGAADTTEIGARLDITIAVDGDSLPCKLETRLGTELASSVTYDSFGEEITIDIPAAAKAVTPPAASPSAHD
ncbi:MAG: hypothetical protein ACR2J8_11310, partial [Thermomicrobiales bacterium]